MNPLTVIPAIDLKDGQCVRLRRGKADDKTVYASDPVAVARQWQARGAAWLHVVDLDGAFSGCPVHDAVIRRIIDALDIPVQTGGGLRTPEDIAQRLNAGAARVILGTRACASPASLTGLVAAHGDRLAVGIDARDGFVQIKGWVETTRVTAVDLAQQLADIGVATLVYTDTATDGMLAGPNLKAMAEMCDVVPGCTIIASGGVAAAEHIRDLRRLGRPNLRGVIVGKALYDGITDFESLQEASTDECNRNNPG